MEEIRISFSEGFLKVPFVGIKPIDIEERKDPNKIRLMHKALVDAVAEGAWVQEQYDIMLELVTEYENKFK